MNIIDFIANPENLYTWQVISILIMAGFLVGVINTIAGSGTVITYSLFMAMGMPANISNGTIRVGVVLQTLAATLNFNKKGVLDLKKGVKIAIPIAIGSIAGAQIAASIDTKVFEKLLAVIMLFMIFILFSNPTRWTKGIKDKIEAKLTWKEMLIFLAIGLYGGFTHIGVGIFLLSALVLKAGYDLVRANAIKVLTVLIYSPFALLIFVLNNQVDYRIGLISAIGNIVGGIVGARLSVSWGANFTRWFLIIIILLFASKIFGLWALL
ncbi:MAG: sulfite exporter TauE/SafE family protein [Bacteroidales bacterium]|nr:sulfite exporter TauE/SafE family protein [Bacteroidales bacterium]MBN2748645.1 sulfite exporter TauE/SafE family protein [Bacteroidales bacterium]